MTKPNRPFRLNVGFIVHREVGYSHDFPFEFDEIQIGDDLDLRNFDGVANFGRTPQGLILRGDFSAKTILTCVRCLSDFEQDIRWNMTELYAFNERSADESEQILPEDAQIDLGPILREYALLETPISPLCRRDCKGLCPLCGQDLNQHDCGHRSQTQESPFTVLKDLLEE